EINNRYKDGRPAIVANVEHFCQILHEHSRDYADNECYPPNHGFSIASKRNVASTLCIRSKLKLRHYRAVRQMAGKSVSISASFLPRYQARQRVRLAASKPRVGQWRQPASSLGNRN